MAGLKILGRITSINVRKATWLADELGLAYEREDWGMPIRDPKVPEFLTLNPNGTIPVMIDEGFVLWESGAILRYLAEKHGTPLWPENLRQRGLADQWLTWQASELNPAWTYTVMALLRKNPAFNDPDQIARSIGRWGDCMGLLEDQLNKTGAFIAGETFTLADIALGLSVHRWFSVAFDKPDLPAVKNYYEKLKTRAVGPTYLTEATP